MSTYLLSSDIDVNLSKSSDHIHEQKLRFVHGNYNNREDLIKAIFKFINGVFPPIINNSFSFR